MRLAGPALWAAARARTEIWDRIARSPRALQSAQEAALRANCRAAAASEFGQTHALEGVRSHADLRSRVPLRTYDDFEPYVARLHRGERDVLLPGVIPYLARSAGSTRRAAKKELPISRRQIAWQRRQAFDILARYLVLSGDLGFPRGYTLGFLPPPAASRVGAVDIGVNPGLMQLHMPRIAQRFSLPRSPIRDITDQDERLRAIARAYLDHDVRAIAGTTCWFTVLFDRVREEAAARGRAVSSIREIWPNLRGLLGGGVRAAPYRAVLDEQVGRRMTLIDTYNATEGGCFAVTDRQGADDLLVVPDRGVFYELVPRGGRERVPLWAVERDVDYSVVLSTSSGLFGYVIGDVVRFTSLFPHRLVFSGRAGGELAIAHEATTARQIEDAVGAAAARHACTVVEHAASAELTIGSRAVGRYRIFVELEKAPVDLAAFGRSIDASLCASNWLYGLHRKDDVALLPLTVVPLTHGATKRFAEAIGRSGAQQKFPRVIQPHEHEILRLLEGLAAR